MFTHLGHEVLVAVGLAVIVAACHETEPIGTATTTGAAISNDTAVLQVARARCRRANECNHLGSGQRFASETQCIEAYRDEGAGLRVLRTCANGVDQGRLDQCIATLVDQHCDAELGPVTAMPECSSYCR